MIYFAIGFRKSLKNKESQYISQPNTTFTVIIPFRNEIESLPALVSSLRQLEKPAMALVKIVFVDDHSEDGSKEFIESELKDLGIEYEFVQNKGTGKKAALKTGIDKSNTNWIITTDADVEVPATWLTAISNKLKTTKAEMLVMPVQLLSNGTFFSDIQKLESAALVSMSAGALANKNVFSANGANFAFTKNIFEKSGGYTPEIQHASGDDEFLLKRVFGLNKSLVEVFFVKDVIVKTKACKTLSELISQRTRWASKVKIQMLSWKQYPVIIPSVFMLLLILSIPYSLLSRYNLSTSGLLLDKWIGDLILFFAFSSFFGYSLKSNLKVLLLILAMPFYQLFYMIPVFYKRFMGDFSWKGRSYGN